MPFLWSASRRARPVGGRTFSYSISLHSGSSRRRQNLQLPRLHRAYAQNLSSALWAQIGARHLVRRQVGC